MVGFGLFEEILSEVDLLVYGSFVFVGCCELGCEEIVFLEGNFMVFLALLELFCNGVDGLLLLVVFLTEDE